MKDMVHDVRGLRLAPLCAGRARDVECFAIPVGATAPRRPSTKQRADGGRAGPGESPAACGVRGAITGPRRAQAGTV